MVDIEVISQLINSMEVSLTELEKRIVEKNFHEANKLKTFIFDLQTKIDKSLRGVE